MTIEAVTYYLELARSGFRDEAFHGLRELSHDALPVMQSAYHNEHDPNIRELLVEAIWQHRQSSVIDFLLDALRHPDARVWKQALDGLVALASPAAIQALRSVWDRETDSERRAWFEEAIDQAGEEIERQSDS